MLCTVLQDIILTVFKCICKIVKSNSFVRVCLSAWNSLAPTGWIFLKFEI